MASIELEVPRFCAMAAALALCGCAREAVVQDHPPLAPPVVLHRFDLVARGIDDNGFGLNPQFGYAFAHRDEGQGDPSSCSWRFVDPSDPDDPAQDVRAPERPFVPKQTVCNSHPLDPVFADNVGTMLGMTCSDSPLHFPGHLNYARSFGGALTFEGVLQWDNYSGDGPFGDFDYNFIFMLPPDGTAPGQGPLSPRRDVLHLEMDSRETAGFGSAWWSDLRQIVHGCSKRAAAFVGKADAVTIAVLSIDAEHMAPNDLVAEAHPVYLLAFRTCDPDEGADQPRSDGKMCDADAQVLPPKCVAGQERWMIVARDRASGGYCSPRASLFNFMSPERVALPLAAPVHSLAVRLPWRCGSGLTLGGSKFHESAPTSGVTVGHMRGDTEVLVSVDLPDGVSVDGELVLNAAGACIAASEAAAGSRRLWKSTGSATPPAEPSSKGEPKQDPEKAEARRARARNAEPRAWKQYLDYLGQPPPALAAPVRQEREHVPPRQLAARGEALLVPESLPVGKSAAAVSPLVPEPAAPARAPKKAATTKEFCEKSEDPASKRICDILEVR